MGEQLDIANIILNYQQADEDGVMVIVSRQALHEASDELHGSRDRIASLEARCEGYREALEFYGDRLNYLRPAQYKPLQDVIKDGGKKARAALAKEE